MSEQQQNLAMMGGLFQTGDPTHKVQGERCVEVKGGWWPVRQGYPPEHIRIDQQPWPADMPR